MVHPLFRRAHTITVLSSKKIKNVPKNVNLMKVLSSHNIPFAYPFKHLLFPFLHFNLIPSRLLPKLQNAMGFFSKTIPSFGQDIISIKKETESKGFFKNYLFRLMRRNDGYEPNFASRTKVDSDMIVEPNLRPNNSKLGGYLSTMYIIYSLIAVVLVVLYTAKREYENYKERNTPLSEADLLLYQELVYRGDIKPFENGTATSSTVDELPSRI
ncbi:hypothetical protein ABK040_001112 [Willaertia magna]